MKHDVKEIPFNKLRYRNQGTLHFKSKRWEPKSSDYQKGYEDAINKTIEYLKEHDVNYTHLKEGA